MVLNVTMENSKHLLTLLFNAYHREPVHFLSAYQKHCRLYLDELNGLCYNNIPNEIKNTEQRQKV